MITLIIGHRGMGKTALARKFAPGPVIDLDAEIEKQTGESPSQIFHTHGEERFRELELETLSSLLKVGNKNLWIVLGAGFPLDRFQKPKDIDIEIQFWRRETDSRGRFFTDRPRLNAAVSPLEEYLQLYPIREARYRQYADWIFEWPEGEHVNRISVARQMLSACEEYKLAEHGGIWTIRSGDRERYATIQKHFMNWGFTAFELRTDLLAPNDLEFWTQNLPHNKILWAERRSDFVWKSHAGFWGADWATELGQPPVGSSYNVYSGHQDTPPDLPKNSPPQVTAHLKWSPMVDQWKQLWDGFAWQQEAPELRSFLPRSKDGRWTWYRLWMKGKQKLNFVRECVAGEAPDQPTILEWLNSPLAETFAAILGDPVDHSWTPAEQSEFFVQKSMPIVRVKVASDEWDDAFPILEKMGLRAVAVTSPLKITAHEHADVRTARADQLRAANTLKAQGTSKVVWAADNTDELGLRLALEEHGLLSHPYRVKVWGGGGTLNVLRDIFPTASFYSVRTGELRPGSPEPSGTGPVLWIWAAGPDHSVPEIENDVACIVDLNYRQDSRARELAQKHKARYISGESMFHRQAEAQREFWKDLES